MLHFAHQRPIARTATRFIRRFHAVPIAMPTGTEADHIAWLDNRIVEAEYDLDQYRRSTKSLTETLKGQYAKVSETVAKYTRFAELSSGNQRLFYTRKAREAISRLLALNESITTIINNEIRLIDAVMSRSRDKISYLSNRIEALKGKR